MIPLKPIKSLPAFKWLKHSLEEISTEDAVALLEASDFAYAVGNVATIGLIYYSYASPPWMWFALAEGIGIKELIDFRRLVLQIPLGTITAVRADYKLGIRFAKLYRFEDTGNVQYRNGVEYKLFRRV